MKIKQLNLSEADESLESATVVLTPREIYLIASMIGPTSPLQRDEIAPYGGESGNSIYNGLSNVVNMFYDDGLNEMRRNL